MIKHITIFIGLFSRHLLYNISNSKNPKKYKKRGSRKRERKNYGAPHNNAPRISRRKI